MNQYDVHYYTEVRFAFKGVKANSPEEAFKQVDDNFDFNQINEDRPNLLVPHSCGKLDYLAWTEGVAQAAIIDGPEGETLLDEGGFPSFNGQLERDVLKQRVEDAKKLSDEITSSFGSLVGIEEQLGYEVIIELWNYQQSLISGNEFKVRDPLFIKVLDQLPSSEYWMSKTQCEAIRNNKTKP